MATDAVIRDLFSLLGKPGTNGTSRITTKDALVNLSPSRRTATAAFRVAIRWNTGNHVADRVVIGFDPVVIGTPLETLGGPACLVETTYLSVAP